MLDGKISNLSVELNYFDNYDDNTLYQDNVVVLYEGNDKLANILCTLLLDGLQFSIRFQYDDECDNDHDETQLS